MTFYQLPLPIRFNFLFLRNEYPSPRQPFVLFASSWFSLFYLNTRTTPAASAIAAGSLRSAA
jgi:hypothetical protein